MLRSFIFWYLVIGFCILIFALMVSDKAHVEKVTIEVAASLILLWAIAVPIAIAQTIKEHKSEPEEPTKEDLEAIAKAAEEDPNETISLEEYKKQRGDTDV